MDEKRYTRIADTIRGWKYGVAALTWTDRIITWLTFGAYPLLLVYLWFFDTARVYESVLVPAVSFAVVSIYRRYNHSRRPYEAYGIKPLLAKNTRGRSFPSRHVFSIFMVGMAYLGVVPWMGLLLFVLGVVLGVVRVLGGVHYIHDVAAGAAIGILCGWMGFYLIF